MRAVELLKFGYFGLSVKNLVGTTRENFAEFRSISVRFGELKRVSGNFFQGFESVQARD